MNFKTYFSGLSQDGKNDLAARLNTSIAYLYQLNCGNRKPGYKFFSMIESATNGKVTPNDLIK